MSTPVLNKGVEEALYVLVEEWPIRFKEGCDSAGASPTAANVPDPLCITLIVGDADRDALQTWEPVCCTVCISLNILECTYLEICLFLLYGCRCLVASGWCTMYMPGTLRRQRGHRIPWNWSLRQSWAALWVLENELKSSGRVASALDHTHTLLSVLVCVLHSKAKSFMLSFRDKVTQRSHPPPLQLTY